MNELMSLENTFIRDSHSSRQENDVMNIKDAVSISIDDDYSFDRIVDVLNEVFHKDYGAWMRGFCYLDETRTVGAWFPKMAVIENGKELPQSKTKAWINVLSEDGKEIRMYTNDLSLRSSNKNTELHLTFAKFPGEPYRYIGTFVRDLPRCSERDVRFVRVATSFDIADYL